jgi:hypothetical protein
MNEEGCFSPEPQPGDGGTGGAVDLAAVRDRLARTQSRERGQAAPAFVIQLDRMSKTATSAEDRLDDLRELKRPLLKPAAALPEPAPTAAEWKTATPSIEQRLGTLPKGRPLPRGLIDRGAVWAAEGRLADPGGYLGKFGVFAVETSKHALARRITGALNDGFRGWVLIPRPQFVDAIAVPEQPAQAPDLSTAMRAGGRAI